MLLRRVALQPKMRLHSIVPHLLEDTDSWCSGLALGMLMVLAFIHLKKVIDIVDHEVLCKKLEHCGV